MNNLLLLLNGQILLPEGKDLFYAIEMALNCFNTGLIKYSLNQKVIFSSKYLVCYGH